MIKIKHRYEVEIEGVKKKVARKIQRAFNEWDNWRNKFESSNKACLSLVSKIQEMQEELRISQTSNDTMQNKVHLQEQVI